MSRVIFVYNSKSSHASDIGREVASPLKELISEEILSYEISPISFEYNVAEISKLLKPGDLVISAGGDGTSLIAANAILVSELDQVTLGVLGYGNFNDLAATFKTRKSLIRLLQNRTHTTSFFPLKIKINGKFFRYGLAYSSIGLVAGSVYEFEKTEIRSRLNKSTVSNFFFSFSKLFPYYLEHKNIKKLPDFSLNGKEFKNVTDYFAFNSPRMAKIFLARSHRFTNKKFLSAVLDVSHFFRTIPFAFRSLFRHTPATSTTKDKLVFSDLASLDFQSEGEYRKLEGVKTLEFEKSSRPIRIISLRR